MNIVITGASRGIGYELVKKFVRQKHHVIAVARSLHPMQQLEKEMDSAYFSYIGFDLLETDYSKELLPFVKERFHKVDILINNAGLLISKPLAELTDLDFDLVFGTNVKSAFKLVRSFLPLFSEHAHIVNISSMGGVQGSAKFPGLSIYSAAKGALAVFTECLAEELKPGNIKANALAIGAVQTEMLAEAFPGYKAPLKADEMAEFIVDFALNGHRFFNGKILPVSLSIP